MNRKLIAMNVNMNWRKELRLCFIPSLLHRKVQCKVNFFSGEWGGGGGFQNRNAVTDTVVMLFWDQFCFFRVNRIVFSHSTGSLAKPPGTV